MGFSRQKYWSGVPLPSPNILPPIRPTETSAQRKVSRIRLYRKCIIFYQDYIRPHVSLMNRQKLLQLGWQNLSAIFTRHYTFELPFISVFTKFSLIGKISIPWKTIKDYSIHLEQFFAQKDKKFWEGRIMKLPLKRQNVVEQNRE